MSDDEYSQAFDRVFGACKDLHPGDSLIVLLSVWITLAGHARDAQMGRADGFRTEQARQLELLRKATTLVHDAAPDSELERLIRAGDEEGVARRLRELHETNDTE